MALDGQGDGGVRQLAVVEDLVLEVGELLDDLLALGLLLSVVDLGDGTVDVVDGLCLPRVRNACCWDQISILTKMTGQRLRTESLAKDVGSEVMDWAVGTSVSDSEGVTGSSSVAYGSWYRTPSLRLMDCED